MFKSGSRFDFKSKCCLKSVNNKKTCVKAAFRLFLWPGFSHVSCQSETQWELDFYCGHGDNRLKVMSSCLFINFFNKTDLTINIKALSVIHFEREGAFLESNYEESRTTMCSHSCRFCVCELI